MSKLESSTFGKLVTLLNLDLSYNKIEKSRRGVFVGKKREYTHIYVYIYYVS